MASKFFALGAVMIGLTATGAQAADVLNVLNAGTGAHALTSTVYTQNFNGLKATSLDSIAADALPSGWQAYESGKLADGTYKSGAASSATVSVWSYGSGSDRALGGRVGPDLPLLYVGAIFENALDGVIDSLAISYTGEQWQNGFNRATLMFEYSLDATNLVDGTWTAFSALDFLAPSTAAHTGSQFGISPTNGNNAAFRAPVSGLIDGLSIGAGDSFGLRWKLADIGNPLVTTDDGLAIDDFRLTATVAPVPEPASWAMMIGGFALAGGVLRRRTAQARIACA